MENVKLEVAPSKKSSNRRAARKAVAQKAAELSDIVRRTMLSAQRYKGLDVYGPTELTVCLEGLESIYDSLRLLVQSAAGHSKLDPGQGLATVQEASTAMSALFRTFGTERISDLVRVCLGSSFEDGLMGGASTAARYAVMMKYVHPINYKVMSWKTIGKASGRAGPSTISGNSRISGSTGADPSPPLRKNRIVEDFMIVETASDLDGFDLARTSKAFQTKVYGLKFALNCPAEKKTLIVCGLVDDVPVACLDDPFVTARLTCLREERPTDPDFSSPAYGRFVECLTLKELLVYSDEELHDRFIGLMNQAYLAKQRTISQTTRDFLGADLYAQRSTLLQLLLMAHEHEYQYLAYLLYDLLSGEASGPADSAEQSLLFDSLPWGVKKSFQDAMRQTAEYTKSLANFDAAKIPLEQQICLLKAPDAVKEKAMFKLKEVKAKSEDSGSKARQFLEGLLRIPFGTYREEPVLSVLHKAALGFTELAASLHAGPCPPSGITPADSYTSLQVRQHVRYLANAYPEEATACIAGAVMENVAKEKRSGLVEAVTFINNLTKGLGKDRSRVLHSGKNSAYMREKLAEVIERLVDYPDLLWRLAVWRKLPGLDAGGILARVQTYVTDTTQGLAEVGGFVASARDILDSAVYGHAKAKRQVERVVGQWANGEPTGYCFGFEGPPGVGKTSLAKEGIARCLVGEGGEARPFAFVAIGGSSNGSTLEGHNYTYVGSTWGRIVDILIEKKCMNPIIFIDELDKVSRTEHGRELTGILTHLVDPAQNKCFQDKYFSGIDIDLSRVLFVFSYNDPDAIDRVLLDRIHRVKFSHLSTQEKLVVANTFLLPDIYKKMGLPGMIKVTDDAILGIIGDYTREPGVRKLKEMLFEIVGEINLEIMSGDPPETVPIVVDLEMAKTKYLKARRPLAKPLIHQEAKCGLMTGLWANAHGQGGILPIEARWRPCDTAHDLKLTGMQGDVMKESMAVARTVAWGLLDDQTREAVAARAPNGVHVHVPEGATPKDGPSAGGAIALVLYSLFTGSSIRNDVAMTGELCLQGKITAIGGLGLKIQGAQSAGVKLLLYPRENQRDLDEFLEKADNKQLVERMELVPVETVREAMDWCILADPE